MSLENQISYEVIGAARDKTLCCPHIFFSLNYRFADSLRSSRSLRLLSRRLHDSTQTRLWSNLTAIHLSAKVDTMRV